MEFSVDPTHTISIHLVNNGLNRPSEHHVGLNTREKGPEPLRPSHTLSELGKEVGT